MATTTSTEGVVLNAEPRTDLGTRRMRRLRLKGYVPCVLYSKKDETEALQVKTGDFEKALKKGARVLDLKHPKGKDKVLVKAVQYDHLGERLLHADFYKIALDEAIIVEIPLILKGKPVGVTEEGGMLDQYVKTVKVSCLPLNIPKSIEVDVTHLKLDQNLLIKDIQPPSGVKILQEPGVVVAAVTIHVVEEVTPAAAATPGPTEPELIKKEVKVEEGEEAPAAGGKAEKTAGAAKPEKATEKPKEASKEKEKK